MDQDGRRAGRKGSARGVPYLPCQGRGWGGWTPTSTAQNEPHVTLIILTTHMWGGGGGGVCSKKTFSG